MLKFVVDECVGPAVASWLCEKGSHVISIYDSFPSVSDTEVLNMAVAESAVLITNDKDFGDMIFLQKKQHHGIVLLRLVNDKSVNKIKILQEVLERYSNMLVGNFILATDGAIRVIKLSHN